MKYISIALAVILSACSGLSTKTSDNEYDPTQEKPEFYLGGFDGVWVGDVQQIKGHEYPFVAKGDSKFSTSINGTDLFLRDLFLINNRVHIGRIKTRVCEVKYII